MPFYGKCFYIFFKNLVNYIIIYFTTIYDNIDNVYKMS